MGAAGGLVGGLLGGKGSKGAERQAAPASQPAAQNPSATALAELQQGNRPEQYSASTDTEAAMRQTVDSPATKPAGDTADGGETAGSNHNQVGNAIMGTMMRGGAGGARRHGSGAGGNVALPSQGSYGAAATAQGYARQPDVYKARY